MCGTELATTTVKLEQLPLERWFDGSVEAVKQGTISAETKGRVAELFFDIGDAVPKGAVILTLVSNEQREALNQAKARLIETQATVEAESTEFKRINALYTRKIVSKSDWDRANVRFNIAQAQVTSAKAGLKTAIEQLSYTEIRAPYSGVISARHVELGEAVQPGLALISGFDPKLMRVVVTLPQSIADKVRIIKEAQILTEGGITFLPTKIILYPIADPTTSTVKVRLELPETKTVLYPGELVKVGFTVGDIKRLLVPVQSVIFRSEVSGIYVVKNNIPSLRQVRIGKYFKNKVEILAGLEEGEKIAVDPVAAEIVLHSQSLGTLHD